MIKADKTDYYLTGNHIDILTEFAILIDAIKIKLTDDGMPKKAAEWLIKESIKVGLNLPNDAVVEITDEETDEEIDKGCLRGCQMIEFHGMNIWGEVISLDLTGENPTAPEAEIKMKVKRFYK